MGGDRPPTLLSYAAFISLAGLGGSCNKPLSTLLLSYYESLSPFEIRSIINGFDRHFVPAVLLNSTFYQGSVVRTAAPPQVREDLGQRITVPPSLSCGQFALANLLASQEHLMNLISPRIRHIDRKRGEGLSFDKKGCSGPGLSQLSKG
ncbi:hypothetical protein QVD17_38244 [Tagetes erecta]|uniref:Uncharacterized protein n=1 Tax=Tagetes erecta TaxID=13708 RepID=A0AAD8JVN1_TARER|nr:hypothetical protein QVD17_38244 [Tagetes erecta]